MIKRTQLLKIKVCGISSLESLDRIFSLKPDYIGLNFWPGSKRFLSAKMAYEIVSLCPVDINKVGVFVNQDLREVLAYVREYDLDFVQLHGHETPDYCEQIAGHAEIIKAAHLDAEFDFESIKKYQDLIFAFLFDTKTSEWGGSGLKFSWEILKEYHGDVPFFLSGGIGLEDVDEIMQLDFEKLSGIDINSKFELAPGLKDPDKLAEFFNRICQKSSL